MGFLPNLTAGQIGAIVGIVAAVVFIVVCYLMRRRITRGTGFTIDIAPTAEPEFPEQVAGETAEAQVKVTTIDLGADNVATGNVSEALTTECVADEPTVTEGINKMEKKPRVRKAKTEGKPTTTQAKKAKGSKTTKATVKPVKEPKKPVKTKTKTTNDKSSVKETRVKVKKQVK